MIWRKKKVKVGEKSVGMNDDELVEYILENRELRQRVIEKIKDDVEDKLNVVLVEAIKQANERPSKWWEWLFLLFAGAMAGIGIGFVYAIQHMGVPTP